MGFAPVERPAVMRKENPQSQIPNRNAAPRHPSSKFQNGLSVATEVTRRFLQDLSGTSRFHAARQRPGVRLSSAAFRPLTRVPLLMFTAAVFMVISSRASQTPVPDRPTFIL